MSAVRRIARGIETTVTVVVALICIYLFLSALPGYLGAMGFGLYQDPYFLAESMAKTVLGLILLGTLFGFGKLVDYAVGGE